jgi:hypothetical protein
MSEQEKLSADDQAFVVGFCKKAAELGITPQKLVKCAGFGAVIPFLTKYPALTALLAGGAAVGAGGLAGGGAALAHHKLLPPIGGGGKEMSLAEEEVQRQLAEKFRQATLDARLMNVKKKQKLQGPSTGLESMDEPIFAV